MHTHAKRVHNITPKPVRLTFTDGSQVTLEMRSAEFFQDAFQGEGTDEAGVVHRMVSDGDDDPLTVARESEDGWAVLGTVETVERVER
jgi:hypothetical protein